MTRIQVRPIADASSSAFASAVAIYQEAFPASERKPVTFLAETVERADYRLYCAERDGGTIAMAVVYRSAEHAFALLEYMAVASAWRGAGAGAHLFMAVAGLVDRTLLLEVESERPGEEGAVLRRRRLGFYRRLGCLAVEGLDYVMPKVSAAAPPPMQLLVHGWPGVSMPGPALCTWLDDVYAHVYARPLDDPDLRKMRESIGESAPLG